VSGAANWGALMTAVDAHLVAAGATLTPPITKVRRGPAFSIPTDMFAYWYDGRQPSRTGGNTFAKTNIEERLTVELYIRIGGETGDDYSAAVEDRMRAATSAVCNRLWGDWDLGGNAIGISIEATSTDRLQVTGGAIYVVTIPVYIDLGDEDSIVQ
jgi:heat shock protein HslJ